MFSFHLSILISNDFSCEATGLCLSEGEKIAKMAAMLIFSKKL